jgi:hypothetical protein
MALEIAQRAALRLWRGAFHALYPGHPPACAPAFTLCGTDVTGSSDLELDGIMDHAPGSRLIRRQGRQVGEIGPAALAHPAGARTGQGVKPHGPERLPADTTKSRFHGHS